MPGALRMGDFHKCLKQNPNGTPHVGGPGGGPVPPAATTVRINGRVALTVGDSAICVSPTPDSIVGGIASVRICGKPAADSTAKTDHGGTFESCSGNVNIG
jgi:uncharacterized Zn-binding protein involved in type VI secretion